MEGFPVENNFDSFWQVSSKNVLISLILIVVIIMLLLTIALFVEHFVIEP